MFLKNRILQHKKRWAAGAVAVVVCTSGALMYPAMASAPANAQQGVYKESPVGRGSVTVGINESGTASLEAIAITYDDYSSSDSSDDTTVKALVEEVYVKAGQRVLEGDPIAKISTDEIQTSLDTLQQDRKAAELALAKAKLDQEEGTITAKSTLATRLDDATNADLNYELDIDSNNANLATLRSTYLNAYDKMEQVEQELDDFMGLEDTYNDEMAALKAQIDTGTGDTAALQKQFDDISAALANHIRNFQDNRVQMYAEYSSARNTYDSAKLKHEIAANTQTTAEAQAETDRATALSYKDKAQQLYDLEIGQLANSVSSKSLTLENLDKKIAKLQAYLTDGQVKATCEGLIMNVYVVAGDKVDANSTLAAIANSKNIYVSVNIDQEDIATLALGRAANIAFDAYPNKIITGVVDSISVTPAMGSSSTVSYQVKVKLDTEEESVYEGMTGTVTFVTEEAKDVLTVSAKAVYKEGESSFVKVLGADGNITAMPVEVGLTNNVLTEITSGLNEGDIAIIESKAGAKTK